MFMRSSWKRLSFECWKESLGVCPCVRMFMCVSVYAYVCVRVCICVYMPVYMCLCVVWNSLYERIILNPSAPCTTIYSPLKEVFLLKYSRSTDLFELNVSTWCRICKEISFAPRFLRYEDKLFFISHNEFVVTICTSSRVLVKEHFLGGISIPV